MRRNVRAQADLGVWFPTVRTGTGTQVFTERLVESLLARGIRADVSWLPLRAEYAPWTVEVPEPPAWATVAHVGTWLHHRFLPKHIPVVATLHHSVHDPSLRPYKDLGRHVYHRTWIAPMERRILRRADKITAVSRFVADSARAAVLDVAATVIHNGVDLDSFTPIARARRTGAFKLLYAGSLTVRKGADLLAPVMRALGADYELHYTGDGRFESTIGAAPNMRDIGRLDGRRMIAAMQDADVLLFPSRSEGLPLVVIEAMACGLPVVACAASSLPEVVDDGVTGLLVPPDDVSALAGSVRRLRADEKLRASMADAARARAEKDFSNRAMTDAYLDCYRDAIEGRHS